MTDIKAGNMMIEREAKEESKNKNRIMAIDFGNYISYEMFNDYKVLK